MKIKRLIFDFHGASRSLVVGSIASAPTAWRGGQDVHRVDEIQTLAQPAGQAHAQWRIWWPWATRTPQPGSGSPCPLL